METQDIVTRTRPFNSVLVHNHKGGSGKTTVACHLAWYFAEANIPAVLLDTDAQDNATRWLSRFQWSGEPAFNVEHAGQQIGVVSHEAEAAADLAAERDASMIVDTAPTATIFRQLPPPAHPDEDSLVVIPTNGRMAIDGVVAVLEDIEDMGFRTRAALVAWGADPEVEAHASEIATLVQLEKEFKWATAFRLAVPANTKYMRRAEAEGRPYWSQQYADRTHTGKAMRAFCEWVARGARIGEADARDLGVSDDLRDRLWIAS